MNASNDKIKNNPKTLTIVTESLHRYNGLIDDAKYVMSNYLQLELDDESRDKVSEFHQLLINYIQDKERLASLVDELKQYQDEPSQADGRNWYLYIVLVMLMIISLFIAKAAHHKTLHRTK